MLHSAEQWIADSFQFLLPHVHWMPGRNIGSPKSKAKGPRVASSTSKSTSQPTGDEEPEEEEDVAANESNDTDMEVVASTSSAPPPTTRVKVEAIRKINERARASAKLQQQVQKLITASTLDQKAAYGNWLAAVSREIHPSIWCHSHQWSSGGCCNFLPES